MYGWRGRLGLILGLPNTVCEPEFNKMVPDGVSVNGARMAVHPVANYSDPDVMKDIEEEVGRLSSTLSVVKPDIVIFTHNAASMAAGLEFDDKLTRLMAKEAGCPGLTAASAIVQALNEVGAKKIAMADPFPRPDLSQIVKDFLEQPALGFQVVNEVSVRGESPNFITSMPPTVAYQFGKKADHPDAEAILLAANVWRTIEVIEALEQDLGKPVISANQASVWAALKIIGVAGIQGYGSLFSRH